jgi:hypothetical protein
MNWDAIGAIGEIIGALAVIGSIVYLAIQIRQNSQLLRSAAQDSASIKYSTTISLQAQSPENARVFHHGVLDAETLPPEERSHFFLMMANTFVQMDYTYQLYLDGTLSQERWDQLYETIQYYFSRKGVRYWWHTNGKRVIIGNESAFAKMLDAEASKYDQDDA